MARRVDSRNRSFRSFRGSSQAEVRRAFSLPPVESLASLDRRVRTDLIGNWEIAGIRLRDVSRPDSITVIGHLEAARAKVTLVPAAFRPLKRRKTAWLWSFNAFPTRWHRVPRTASWTNWIIRMLEYVAWRGVRQFFYTYSFSSFPGLYFVCISFSYFRIRFVLGNKLDLFCPILLLIIIITYFFFLFLLFFSSSPVFIIYYL